MKKLFSTLTLTTATALTIALTGGAISSDSVLGQTSIDLAALRNAAVSQHNTYRAIHKSPNITLSDSLNSTAQAWAEEMVRIGKFEHSNNRGEVGENLYVYSTTAPSTDSTTLGNEAVTEWYKEINYYQYDSPGFSTATGHFTQVVWKGSTQLGCGAAQGTETIEGINRNVFYVVCHYSPGGNVEPLFHDNVLQP